MRKAFDDVISENEKYYLYITEKTHQDQLLLFLGYFSVIGIVKILLRSQAFAEISNLLKKQLFLQFFFPLKLGSESTKQYSAAVRKYHVSDTCLKIAVVEKVGITIMCICPFQEVRVSSSCHFHVVHILPFLLIIKRNQTHKTIVFTEMIDLTIFLK